MLKSLTVEIMEKIIPQLLWLYLNRHGGAVSRETQASIILRI